CANVANLLLARGAARRREIAIRRSVGASCPRGVRQLLLESTLLSLLSGGAGLLVALWLNRFLGTFHPPGSSAALVVPLDERILLFALFLSLLTGLGFGIAPAWQSARTELLPNLKAGGRDESGTPQGWSLRHALVVVQTALSVVVL